MERSMALMPREGSSPMYYCRRCSTGTTEGSAVIVCSIPFCLACACADPQAIIDIAEEHFLPIPFLRYHAG
jgi:hypothetical protein